MSLDNIDRALLDAVAAGRVVYRQGWFLDDLKVSVLDAHRLNALDAAHFIQIGPGGGYAPVGLTGMGRDAVQAVHPAAL